VDVKISEELQYLLVVVGLFLVPRVLQRFRIPSAITCVAIGGVLGMVFHLLHGDSTVPMLATLGIVSLFLFAGLEVDFGELRQGARVVAGHVALQLVLLVAGMLAAQRMFGLPWRPALLMALAVFTPSAGFILDSLSSFGLSEQQRFWVKSKTIASELVALGALFITVQSGTFQGMVISTTALAVMVAVLPLAFHGFVRRVLPYAPKSEFAFLLILALICSYITRKLGVYYLVGAFVVGVTAVRLRKKLPELASERLLIAVELFASFFIPFYFFKSGLHMEAHYFVPDAIILGVLLVAVAVPLKIAAGVTYRRVVLGEPPAEGIRVAFAMVPTLVFTMVLADILHESYHLPDYIYGALFVFALLNTTLPGLFLRNPPPEYDTPEIPRDSVSVPVSP